MKSHGHGLLSPEGSACIADAATPAPYYTLIYAPPRGLRGRLPNRGPRGRGSPDWILRLRQRLWFGVADCYLG